MSQNFDYHKVDLDALKADIDAIEKEVVSDNNAPDQIKHLRKMEWWGRLSSWVGYLTLGLGINPLAILGVAFGKSVRWMMIAHHVTHRGYDRVPGVPARYTSKKFAQGWRRYLDWLDWMPPKGWTKEHNVLHHYYLNERFDPDVVQHNTQVLRDTSLPYFVNLLAVFFMACAWKIIYYAPSTTKTLLAPNPNYKNTSREHDRLYTRDLLNLPFSRLGRKLLRESYLPNILVYFVGVPLLFSLWSPEAGWSALFNMLLAEIVTNLHSFLVVVPNHAGDDLYRFEGPSKGKGEFYLRQIIGSVNFPTGGDGNDCLHGWLNYQIEHHVWPEMTMNQYQRAQPLLKKVCEKHGIPYIQESVFKRLVKLLQMVKPEHRMRVVAPTS